MVRFSCTCFRPRRKGGSSNRGWQELVLAKPESLDSPLPFFQLYARLEHFRAKIWLEDRV